jgi:hypothetical protein
MTDSFGILVCSLAGCWLVGAGSARAEDVIQLKPPAERSWASGFATNSTGQPTGWTSRERLRLEPFKNPTWVTGFVTNSVEHERVRTNRLRLTVASNLVQQAESRHPARNTAPIGTYACFQQAASTSFPSAATNRVLLFTLRLETNGTYVAETPAHLEPTQDGELVRLRPQSEAATGTWQWEAQKQEFRLQPGTFKYYIERLPLDPHNTNRLLWGSGFLQRQENR